ncbi:MAG: RidA family protein [Actinobacteria bacterium]|uniref:Unannotated protein n=1 Tax=freshwater metagenome TaxID=449393 RepID=A0A6J7DV82_9ZZZZ|nr:RidA family protein [Actinomycetota bacterium]
MSTERETFNAPDAPAAVGPYSHAASANGFVFASGQLGLSPDGSGLVPGGVEAQAVQALENLQAVARAAGCELADAVKVTVFLTDMGDFASVNTIYANYFTGDEPPARAAVEVSDLPLGGLIEFEAVFAQR